MKAFRASGPVALLAATAAALIATAPSAAAEITDLTISTGLGNGYGTGCTYELKATTDADAHRIIFLDNGNQRGAGFGTPVVSGNTITQSWTPSQTGEHVITAQKIVGDYETATITVQVGNGINLGSACLAQ
jgi:hypothetical protein